MKITHIIAAGLIVAGIGVSASASAQDYRGGQGYRDNGYRDNDRRNDRRDNWRDNRRGDHNGYRERRWNGHDRGRHYGWRNKYRQQCRTVWRYGHRVRICR